MKLLTASEVTKSFDWYKDYDDEYVHFDDDGPFFAHPEAQCINLEYPKKFERLPFFARYLAAIGYQDWDFRGALIWFHNWSVGNQQDEGIGYRIIDRINIAAGQPMSFEVAPGHQFRADELTDVVGTLMQPMIFGWDSFYLPQWSHGTGEFFLFISHDSFVCLVTRTKAFHDRVFEQLHKLEFNPTPGDDLRVQRFCRRP
jgi:hypothetical protein